MLELIFDLLNLLDLFGDIAYLWRESTRSQVKQM